MAAHFWEIKKPGEFSASEWESVCTRCGQCCRIKLEDEESGEVYFTDVVCRYFNHDESTCTRYADRCKLVPECLKLTPDSLGRIAWMPKRCAYRILHETGALPPWHPLITGHPLDSQFSVCGKVISEVLVEEQDLEDHIIEDDENA